SVSCAAAQRKAEHGVGLIGRRGRRRHTHMVSAVRVVPTTLDLIPRDGDVLSILAPSSKPLSILEGDFRRIAIRLVTTALIRLVGHEPRRVKLLVDGYIRGRVSGVALLCLCIGGERVRGDDERNRGDQAEENFCFHGFLL